MSGNNPFGNQPNQGQPNQGPGPQGQPTPPGPSYGGPSYSGPAYGQGQPQPGPYQQSQPSASGPYGQPTPSGPYPPQYGGPQGPGGPGGPQQPPYGAYGPGQPQPKKSNKLPLIIGAGVLALVIIGTIIGVAVSRSGDGPTADPGPGGGGATSQAPVESKKPSDAVQGYLEALAAGDAQTALSFGSTEPADKTFLTNEVLAASTKLAPITAINVPVVDDEYAYQVAASYKLGDQAVNADFSVEKDGDAWKLREVSNDIDLGSRLNKTVPMIINGVTVQSNKIELFPGAYQFTTGSKNIDYGKNNVVPIESPSDYPRGLSDLRLGLTSAGEKAFTEAVEDSTAKCMKSKDLKNPNCPNNVTKVSGATPKEGTFKWTYDKDAFDNLKITLDYNNPAVATSYVSLGMKAEGQCKGGGCSITPWATPKPAANMMASTIKVVWR